MLIGIVKGLTRIDLKFLDQGQKGQFVKRKGFRSFS